MFLLLGGAGGGGGGEEGGVVLVRVMYERNLATPHPHPSLPPCGRGEGGVSNAHPLMTTIHNWWWPVWA
jgi:hypothetical protein